jgi:hypothetical protein
MQEQIQPRNGVVPVIFSSREDAEAAIAELREVGLADDELGIVIPDPAHHYLIDDGLHESLKGFEHGALVGAPIGAVAGIALAALAVPGIGVIGVGGALLFGGHLGALWGFIAGGYLGMTAEVHHLEDIEQKYEVQLKPEEILVVVVADDERIQRACEIVRRHGARCAERRAAQTA